MDEKTMIDKFEIAKLKLEPDEVLVFKTPDLLDEDEIDKFCETLREVLPDCMSESCLILNGDIEISIISKTAD